jgi:hypothetical protein
MTDHHAPKGGVYYKNKFYKGGQFLPLDYMADEQHPLIGKVIAEYNALHGFKIVNVYSLSERFTSSQDDTLWATLTHDLHGIAYRKIESLS